MKLKKNGKKDLESKENITKEDILLKMLTIDLKHQNKEKHVLIKQDKPIGTNLQKRKKNKKVQNFLKIWDNLFNVK